MASPLHQLRRELPGQFRGLAVPVGERHRQGFRVFHNAVLDDDPAARIDD